MGLCSQSILEQKKAVPEYDLMFVKIIMVEYILGFA